ncbi:MAG: UDP-N-acetylmuramate dehydrogenase [Bacteroides sp.]|nr:UDP-N-acetylmuramate dehydrogenase [Bacteroides sp.]
MWIEYTSIDDLPQVAQLIRDVKHINIGSGSNMLFTGDFDGAVLHSAIKDTEWTLTDDEEKSVIARIGAGVVFDELIERFAANGIWGAENLSGIPGEVGAAAVQNVGAYGVEACNLIRQVECYDLAENKFVTFDVGECQYGYRWSMFKRKDIHDRYIITYVVMKLSVKPNPKLEYGSIRKHLASDTPSVMELRDTIIKIRNEKLPSVDKIGSAGSFFKNPVVDRARFEEVQAIVGPSVVVPHYEVAGGVKIPAAWLIDHCGLKGYSDGNAGVWESQPLVIVNRTGKATAGEILAVENKVISKVKNKFGITLHPEVEHVG